MEGPQCITSLTSRIRASGVRWRWQGVQGPFLGEDRASLKAHTNDLRDSDSNGQECMS